MTFEELKALKLRVTEVHPSHVVIEAHGTTPPITGVFRNDDSIPGVWPISVDVEGKARISNEMPEWARRLEEKIDQVLKAVGAQTTEPPMHGFCTCGLGNDFCFVHSRVEPQVGATTRNTDECLCPSCMTGIPGLEGDQH